jgi:uncharacterized protein (DUF1778 family)
MGHHAEEQAAQSAIVTLQVRAETERMLREKASRRGLSLEEYLKRLAECEAEVDAVAPDQGGQRLTDSEFDHLLDELGAGPAPLPHLAADFTRADIYSDHD